MKRLLEDKFPAHYGITRRRECQEYEVDADAFDLVDSDSNPVVPYKAGSVSLLNSNMKLKVLSYEKYLNAFNGTLLSDGKKRCDFIINDGREQQIVLLCEITSALNTLENLSKPILGSNGEVVFPGGKFEKAELQLYETLANIMPVPEVSSYVSNKARRVCLMAYTLNHSNGNTHFALNAFNRARQMESVEAGDKGAQIASPQIESFGFIFCRICHDYSYQL